jgi:hypothetical protein
VKSNNERNRIFLKKFFSLRSLFKYIHRFVCKKKYKYIYSDIWARAKNKRMKWRKISQIITSLRMNENVLNEMKPDYDSAFRLLSITIKQVEDSIYYFLEIALVKRK